MTSPLSSKWGVAFACLFLVTLFLGMGLLQVWLYFLWYPKDLWRLKIIVILLTMVEITEAVLYMETCYDVLINHFGDYEYAGILKTVDAAQYYVGYLSALIVQLYFAHSVYILAVDWKAKLASAFIVFLALSSIGATTGITILVTRIGLFSGLHTRTIGKLVAVQTSLSVLCDSVITISLSLTFRARDSGWNGSSAMLRTLTINVVNRGMLVAVAALLNMVLFLALPGQLYYFIGFKLASQLYMNSMMATLNTRRRVRRIAGSFNGTISRAGRGKDLSQVEISTVVVESRDSPVLDRRSEKLSPIATPNSPGGEFSAAIPYAYMPRPRISEEEYECSSFDEDDRIRTSKHRIDSPHRVESPSSTGKKRQASYDPFRAGRISSSGISGFSDKGSFVKFQD